jgi:hypothetical protein
MTRGNFGIVVVSLAMLSIVLVLAAPPVTASPTGSVAHRAGVTNTLVTAPIYVHFKPKQATAPQGGTVTIHAVVKDTGGHSFIATSCKLWFRYGTSGTWSLLNSCLSSSSFPHTFAAHSKSKFHSTNHVSATFPTGTYQWKIVLIGTFNGVSEQSHPGILSVTIT